MSKGIDRAEVEALYRKYWFQVHARCRRILASEEEARDAAQEVFVRLLAKGEMFRGESNWMTWLYRVATNVCLHRISKVNRRDKRWQEDVLLATKKTAESDLETTLSNRATLERALTRSDSTTQQVALYHFWDEMTQQEIGDLLGISRVTVNKKIAAFRKLVDRMAAEVESSG